MISTFLWYFLSPSGRVSRQEYRLGALGLVAAGVVLGQIVDFFIFYGRSGFGYRWDRAELEQAMRLPRHVVFVVLFWPFISILIKRLHDLNVSGWWTVALVAMPFVAVKLSIVSTILLGALAIIGLLPGSTGTNRFGSDPLSPRVNRI